MKIKLVLAGAFLFGIVRVNGQELPVTKPQKIMSMPQMDVPVLTTDSAAALKEANIYLAKIKKVLSKDDFNIYRKKEAELVPSGNPFGLLKIRQKYYKIFTDNKTE